MQLDRDLNNQSSSSNKVLEAALTLGDVHLVS